MNIHQNAKLTPQSRADIVRRVLDEGQSPAAVAAAVGVCARTVRKWVARYQTEGADGLRDRSSRPHRIRGALPPAVTIQVVALRRLRWTGAQIAATLGVSPATVSRVLRRQGIARLSALEPAPPALLVPIHYRRRQREVQEISGKAPPRLLVRRAQFRCRAPRHARRCARCRSPAGC